MATSDHYPTEFYEEVRSLPDTVDQTALSINGLKVVEGLTEELAQQLVEASKQDHVGKFCPNDPGSRFGDIDKVRVWQAKGRLALPLVKKAGDGALTLAGFGWMGPGKPGEEELTLPDAKITFAFRLYANALRKGNAAPYVKTILAAHDALYDSKGVWLETWLDNKKAIAAYHKAGFQDSGILLQPGYRHMRQYMMLGEVESTEE